MKPQLLLILIFCFSFKALAQKVPDKTNAGVDLTRTNTYIVEYNFEKAKYEANKLKIKVGTPVSFRVSNINRLAYLVGVTSKDTVIAETNLTDFPFSKNELVTLNSQNKFGVSTLATSQSNQLETISTSEMAEGVKDPKKDGKTDLPAAAERISALRTDLNFIAKSTELTESVSILQNRIGFFAYKNKTLKDSIGSYELKVEELTKMESAASDSLRIQLNKQKNTINAVLESLKSKNTSIEKSLTESKAQMNKIDEDLAKTEKVKNDALIKFKKDHDQFVAAFESLKFSYFDTKKAIQFYHDIKVIAENPLLTSDLYQKKYKKEIDTIKNQLPYLISEAIKFEKLYTDLETLYSNLKYNPSLGEVLNFGGQVKLYSHSNYLKTVADKMYAVVSNGNMRNLFDRAVQTIDFLSLPDAFTVTFSPIQPINDAVVFDVKINKRTGNASELYNNLNFKHKEYTYGGTRIDFSLGLAGSYFNRTPVYELSTQKVTGSDASMISIAKKSDDLSVPSLVGLITMSYRSTRYIAFGGSAGLGIDVMNGKIQLSNFYAGPSALFGKYERFTLTTGATVRNVGQLHSGYQVGSVVQGPADKVTNFMSDKYKLGLFVSLSINLTKGIKDNIKQLKGAL